MYFLLQNLVSFELLLLLLLLLNRSNGRSMKKRERERARERKKESQKYMPLHAFETIHCIFMCVWFNFICSIYGQCRTKIYNCYIHLVNEYIYFSFFFSLLSSSSSSHPLIHSQSIIIHNVKHTM